MRQRFQFDRWRRWHPWRRGDQANLLDRGRQVDPCELQRGDRPRGDQDDGEVECNRGAEGGDACTVGVGTMSNGQACGRHGRPPDNDGVVAAVALREQGDRAAAMPAYACGMARCKRTDGRPFPRRRKRCHREHEAARDDGRHRQDSPVLQQSLGGIGRMSRRTRTRPIGRAGAARLARRAFIIEAEGRGAIGAHGHPAGVIPRRRSCHARSNPCPSHPAQ
jgi:hypothetical protein